MDGTILSIIIPTRNRVKYAISCIQSILDINDNRIEVVVHDNSDTNELEEYFARVINDKRLVYQYTASPMSMVDNFNKAMDLVSGEYICFIGDDDGVNSEIIDVAVWAKKKNLDAVVGKISMGYNWPNDKHTGNFYIYPFFGRCSSVDIENELNQFLADGGVYYLDYNIPKVYHGVVKKECFDKVKDKLGYYFWGLSPDVFSSIAISLVANKVVSLDYPLTIAGSSSASDQTHRTEEAKNINLENAPHFRAMNNYVWSERVPSVYSVPTIWAESSIKALEVFGRTDLLDRINRFKLVAHVAIDSPHHEKTILKDFLNKRNNLFIHLKFKYTKLSIRFRNILKKVRNRILKIIKGEQTILSTNVSTIEDTARIFQEYTTKKGLSIENYLHE